MTRDVAGFFRADVPGIKEGARYAFIFEDGRALPDPSSRSQPEGVHASSALVDQRGWAERDNTWRGLPLEALTFYELHVGTFTAAGTLDAAAERLADLAELGVSCIELMPLQPFAGARNWGYDGVFPYGVHEAYGGPKALLAFVDRAHALGLAVCLDVVYNHLGPEGNYLGEFGHYFTPRHRTPWGDGINYDGEHAGPVRAFMVGAALQWVRDFGIDALRLDAVHAIPDEAPRHIVGEICDAVKALAAETGRHIHVIVESDLNDRRMIDPPPSGWGASSVWADDLHHALHAFTTGERSRYYADFGRVEDIARALAEGFVYQGQPSRFRGKTHGTETRGLAPSRFVTCSQNHDQVGNRPLGERSSTLVPWEALAPLAATVILGPGLPLLFMGEEYGETRPFLYFTSHSDPELARAVREGRMAEFTNVVDPALIPDPQSPETLERSRLTHRREGKHGALWNTYRELLSLRKKYAETIGSRFPQVQVEDAALALRYEPLELRVNLGPTPRGGLAPWAWSVSE